MRRNIWNKRKAGMTALALSFCLATGNGIPALGSEARLWIPATGADCAPTDTVRTDSDALLRTAANALLFINNVDFWKDWAGDLSFLRGNTGKGTKEEPYQISTKSQLMGLSALAARDMTVREGEGSWPGDYSGACFLLTRDIDLGGMEWLPIGFYRTAAEMEGDLIHSFKGSFDGNGKTVSNFRISAPAWDHIGLFGAVSNSEIKNLTVRPGGVLTGKETAGLLAGSAENSRIYNVKVTGALKASGTAGGAVGEITGGSVLENITADHVSVDSGREKETFTGGIVGRAADSVIADCTVNTGDSLSTRLTGGGYVGGIAGFQNSADIFNAHVMGTVGGNGTQAIGGITGKYASGKMKVARFEGTVASSGLGSMSKEGTFIGTREPGFHFRYGTGDGADAAYLFADSEAKIGAGICGSGIAGDNQYTYDAHVGFWHRGDNFFTLVQGSGSRPEEQRYFYEELEDGILHIADTEEDVRDLKYRPDHFAPNSVGRPARGYLVSVLQIDTSANVQNYYDVAVLTARGESAYCRTLDKSNRGAVAAGDLVTVTTAPRNTGQEKYQMEGTPSYSDENGKKRGMAYQTGGSYTFVMPEWDTEISAVYKKVAAGVRVEPEELSFQVVQERKGSRKKPSTVTEVRDRSGKLIARYINGELEHGTQVQEVRAEAVVDKNNDVADSRVAWSIDDGELIRLKKNGDEDAEGYTEMSASLELNPEAGFFTGILEKAVKDQADKDFKYPIPDTIFGGGNGGGIAVLTVCTRPSASFEGKPVTANCRISVTFQIRDRTEVAAEGAELDKDALSFTVTRRLEGNRLNPSETVTITEPQSLTASFHPDFFDKKDISWTSSDTGIAQVEGGSFDGLGSDGDYKNAVVRGVKDARWIQNLIEEDRGIHERDPYRKLAGKGSRKTQITVTADDTLGNKQTASCEVQVKFVTEDLTWIVPEAVSLDQPELFFELTDEASAEGVLSQSGYDAQKLTALTVPDLNSGRGGAPQDFSALGSGIEYEPYNRAVMWSSSDPSSVTVKDGVVTPVKDAQWITEAGKHTPYYAEKTVVITAKAEGNPEAAAVCEVKLTYRKKCLELDQKQLNFDLVLTKSGSRSRPVLTWNGADGQKLSAMKYYVDGDISWRQTGDILTVDEEGNVTPDLEAGWLKEAQKKYPYGGEARAVVLAECGKFQDACEVKLNFKVIDKTHSSGGSSGSSGGSSSGGSPAGSGLSSGITTSGLTNKIVEMPEGGVTGTWVQDGAGNWLFTGNGRTYADEWGYIHNPYAGAGQSSTDWYRFDAAGHMVTGWYLEPETGDRFYFHPVSDGSLGAMYTGWHFIGKDWFYFNPEQDGRRGRMVTGWNRISEKWYYLAPEDGHLLVNTVTPDGFLVDESGAWYE